MIRLLSSPASAAAALFGGVTGTTKRSGCPCPFIPGLPPQRSPDGPPADHAGRQARALPVPAHGGSAHALAPRPRGVPRRLALTPPAVSPSASWTASAPRTHISRLNSPARTCPCQRFATPLTGRHA